VPGAARREAMSDHPIVSAVDRHLLDPSSRRRRAAHSNNHPRKVCPHYLDAKDIVAPVLLHGQTVARAPGQHPVRPDPGVEDRTRVDDVTRVLRPASRVSTAFDAE
jgi:hypothetical protein